MRLKTARPSARSNADWYRIRNLGDSKAEVIIYDEIGWFGVSAAQFIRELRDLNANRIDLRLNSPGGDVFDGIAIYNLLRSHPATVTTYVDGLAASIASVIAMAGDRVVMQPHSQMMIHDAWGMCIGNAADMTEMATQLGRHSDEIAAIYAEHAGGSVAEWRERMAAETWLTPEEAVEVGLADEVGQHTTEAPERAVSNSWDLSIFRYPGREHAPTPAALAALKAPPVEPAAGPTPTPEGALMALDEGLRERLGLNADADEAAILAAVDELVDKATAPPSPSETKEVEPVAAALPEGTVVIDEATLAELRQQAAEGVAARAQQRVEARDRDLDAAVKAGKFPPARREHWARLYDADPDGTRQTLASLAEGTVPLNDLGEPGGKEDKSSENAAFDSLFSTPGKDA